MSSGNSNKVLVRRQSKIRSDGQGRSVWAEPVESAEFELVSTLALKKILTTEGDNSRKAIAEAAQSAADGVLARDAANGQFEIIDDDELQAILDDNNSLPPVSRPSDVTLMPLSDDDAQQADELSLVSTMALRKVLGEPEPVDETPAAEPGGGFDPYNSS